MELQLLHQLCQGFCCIEPIGIGTTGLEEGGWEDETGRGEEQLGKFHISISRRSFPEQFLATNALKQQFEHNIGAQGKGTGGRELGVFWKVRLGEGGF